MRSKASYTSTKTLQDNIRAARGLRKVDLVLKDITFLDVFSGEFLRSDVAIHNGMIVGTLSNYEGKREISGEDWVAVPGFIDTHVHIESSMMTPVRFQEAVLPNGTTTVIWDPHEIANVWGEKGIEWALKSSEGMALDFFVMVPSCVPSTSPKLGLETSGAHLLAKHLQPFKKHPRVLGLAEMMNFPGLLSSDKEVDEKLMAFGQMLRDGHCPGLSGKDLNAYGVAGIHSCHESTSVAEAQEKMRKGINVLIREGSCAKDADTLLPLVSAYTSGNVGLCSDDRNPLDIAHEGHISFIVQKGLARGISPEEIFRAASFAAARMYHLHDRGAIAPGFLADICLLKRKDVRDWRKGFSIEGVLKRGEWVQKKKLTQVADKASKQSKTKTKSKNLKVKKFSPSTFSISCPKASAREVQAHVIGVQPGQIVTKHLLLPMAVQKDGYVQPDPARDILKIAVLERHHGSGRKSVGWVQGFHLQQGAIATSINHDSHNIIVVGVDDEAMYQAVNRLVEIDGGIVVVGGGNLGEAELCLPIAGLMTDVSPDVVAEKLKILKALTRNMGCQLQEPFLTLSFLALPVIPALKITDRGLVDVEKFRLIELLDA